MITPSLYAITDSTLLAGNAFNEKTEAALAAGIKWIQYRDKSCDSKKRYKQASELGDLCRYYGAKLIINDDVVLAKKVLADGVHLGQTDTRITQAKEYLNTDAIVGSTCHDSITLAQQAHKEGATYIAFGRFFTSNTKPNASVAAISLLNEAKKVGLPVIAIGGITVSNSEQLWQAGAHTLAVCHSLFASNNIQKTIASFNEIHHRCHSTL